MHWVSRAIIGFYHLAGRFDIVEWRLRLAGQENEAEALSQAVRQAIEALEYIVETLGPADVLLFAPDFITYKAAKMAVLLTRVSKLITND